MKHYAIFHKNGKLKQQLACVALPDVFAADVVVEIDDVYDLNVVSPVMENGKIVTKPVKPTRPQPAEHTVYDPALGDWRAIPNDRIALQERGKRATLLKQSDWTQLPDVPLATKAAWATYRQALRDITDQPGWPTDITWPDQPT